MNEKDRRNDESPSVKVEDKRRFVHLEDGATDTPETGEPETESVATVPSAELDAMRARAEAAEKKLYEYAAAVQTIRAEQDAFRARMERNVESRIDMRFGELAAGLVEVLDDLDLALEHATDLASAEPLARGVAIARDRFVQALVKHGVERLELDGAPFDPNFAEAVAMEPVIDAASDGMVVRTVRPGYRLGERVIRPARVTVGRATN